MLKFILLFFGLCILTTQASLAESLNYSCNINSNGSTPKIEYTQVVGSLRLRRCGQLRGNIRILTPISQFCDPADPLGFVAPVLLWSQGAPSDAEYIRFVGQFWLGESPKDGNRIRICRINLGLDGPKQTVSLSNASFEGDSNCRSGYILAKPYTNLILRGFGGQGISGAGLFAHGADMVECTLSVSR